MFVAGGTYFFTLVIADRRQSLLVDRIDDLRDVLRTMKARHPFDLHAMVVLPDHLHMIMQLPEGDCNYPTRIRLIKSAFSRRIPVHEQRNTSRLAKGERGIWQRRYWEHRIRDERDYRNHVDYIHFNPVKRGYVTHPADWPHSSFHHLPQREIADQVQSPDIKTYWS